jgi:hypothetical protein
MEAKCRTLKYISLIFMQYNSVIKLITYTPVDDAMDFSKMHFGFMINMSVKKYIYICHDISLPDSIKL